MFEPDPVDGCPSDASDASDASDVPRVAEPVADRSTTGAGGPSIELPLPELEARITELAGHLNAAHHRFLALVAEFDRRQGWAD
ncbi:MAG: hypothetical protein EHM87_24525, partial [Burkholderiales bacterium]